jgi:hypothetical protein
MPTPDFLVKQADLYTGPLHGTARYATHAKPSAVIFTGLAHDIRKEPGAPLIRVRLEMTPEDAEDLLRTLYGKIQAAKQPAN